MRKILPGLLLFLLSALSAYGQSTTVSGTVTDASTQTWNNGTITFTFVPNSQYPVGPYSWTGGTLQTTISGALNGSGAYSISIPSNTAISPIGSSWVVQTCSQASSPCFTTANITITGATQTLNITPPAISISLTNPTSSPVTAYTDSEISSANIGSYYYSLPNQTFRVCQVVSGQTCTTWANIGTGGTSGFPRLDQVLDPNVNKTFNLGATTLAFNNGALDLTALTSPVKVPIVAGCVTTSAGQLCYDSTLGNWKLFNTTDSFLPTLLASGSYTTGDVLGVSNVAGKVTLSDLGPLNPASGSGIVQASITNIQEGDSLCWDVATSIFVNCTPGVPPVVISGATYNYDGTGSASPERGDILFFTNAGGAALSFPQPSPSGVINANWFTFIKADGGTLTLTVGGTGIFNDNGTNSITVAKGTGCSIFSDPTNTGTLYTKCAMVPLTAGSGVTITPAAYSIAISATGSGGTVTGTGTLNNSTKWTGSTSIGNGSMLEDGTHAVQAILGFDVNSQGAYNFWAPNNAGTGTTANKMSCDDGTGKAIICNHTTTTTNAPIGIAVPLNGATPGTTGSTGECIIGFCSIVMDNSATANHFAQMSTSVDGDLSDVGATAPTNGLSYWYIFSGNSGAGTQAVIRNLLPSELNASAVSGGNGKTFQLSVNGTATTKTIKNFNATTPAAGANNQNLTFQTSASGNTDSISVEVPLATTGQAGIVQLAGALGGTSASPTLASPYNKLRCETGLGDGLNAMAAGTYLQFFCVNTSGSTWTITGINCWTDNNGTSTLNAANNAATGLLTGAVTCTNTKSGGGAAGTQSGTTTLANNDAISFTFVADGTSKQTTWVVSMTQ